VKKIGFIGYGSMASMLLKGFVSSGIVTPAQLVVSSRSKNDNIIQLEKWLPEVSVTEQNVEAAKASEILFVCVKPFDMPYVLNEIVPHLAEDTHLISIAACVTIENLEKAVSCKITRVIPSLTSEVGSGVTLVYHNQKVTREDASLLEELLNTVSTVKEIDEENFEAATNLTSSAPGFIASIFAEFLESALRHSSLSRDEARQMMISTLMGTAKLFMDKNMGFSETMGRVATKGGITEEGIRVLRQGLPEVFDEVFRKTLDKNEMVKAMVKEKFEEKE
jgi:pyrroline-5-carboxylate reductase